jgi:hypothetical protein
VACDLKGLQQDWLLIWFDPRTPRPGAWPSGKKPGDVEEEITKTDELEDKHLDNVSGGIVGPQENPE